MGVGVRVGVRVAVKVGLGVAVGTGVAVGDGVFPCPRHPMTVQAKASETAMILHADVRRAVSLPEYDIEFRGFTELGIGNSVNPFDSLSYTPNSHLITLDRESTVL